MNIALWIAASLVALLYVMAGGSKTFNPAKFTNSAPWAQKLGSALVRTLGVVEILGAVGLVLPQATGVGAPVLTILAAAGFVLLQIVAIGVHIAEKSTKSLPLNVALLLLALFVFLGRLLWV